MEIWVGKSESLFRSSRLLSVPFFYFVPQDSHSQAGSTTDLLEIGSDRSHISRSFVQRFEEIQLKSCTACFPEGKAKAGQGVVEVV